MEKEGWEKLKPAKLVLEENWSPFSAEMGENFECQEIIEGQTELKTETLFEMEEYPYFILSLKCQPVCGNSEGVLCVGSLVKIWQKEMCTSTTA